MLVSSSYGLGKKSTSKKLKENNCWGILKACFSLDFWIFVLCFWQGFLIKTWKYVSKSFLSKKRDLKRRKTCIASTASVTLTLTPHPMVYTVHCNCIIIFPLKRFKSPFYNRRKPQICRARTVKEPQWPQSRRSRSAIVRKTTAAFRRQKRQTSNSI